MAKAGELRRPPLPREHGGWAMLITPPVVALAASGPSRYGLMAMFGWFSAYALRGPVEVLLGNGPSGRAGMAQASPEAARLWLVIFGLLTMALLGPVIYLHPSVLILLLGALAVMGIVMLLSLRGQTRSVAAGSLAAVGLMVGGPLYDIAAFGTVGRQGWLLAGACAAFFVGSVFRVKVLGRERRSGSFRYLSVGLHLLFALMAILIVRLTRAPWLYADALLVPLIWAMHGAVREGKAANLRAIGKSEEYLTILFALMLIVALRLS